MVGGVHRYSRDTQTSVSAHVSQDSDSERLTKMASKLRRHSFLFTLLETEIAKYACETKLRRLFAEDALQSSTSGRKVR